MFGQFVVHLDYMLSAAPARQPGPLDGMSATFLQRTAGLPAFFFGRVTSTAADPGRIDRPLDADRTQEGAPQ